jgi:murein DD-endopeptidase MepM/ murein hydrolase activator NlpD
LQKPPAGAKRQADRLHPARARVTTTSRFNRLSIRAVRAAQAGFHGQGAAAASLATRVSRTLRPLTTPERILPISVATIVAVASLLAVVPATPQGAVGGTEGSGSDVRLAINGGVDTQSAIDFYPDEEGWVDGYAERGDIAFQPVNLPDSIDTKPGSEQSTIDPGPVLDDGTLLTGYAPATKVEDGKDLIETYKVKSGDTLSDIANTYDVSMMTLWWANKLKSKDDLHIGQVLRIPPVSGLVYTVTDTDTLETLAAKYDVSANHIVKLNGLEDPTLVIGQVLVLPGAKGAPIPTPKPTAKPANRSGGSSGPSRSTSQPSGPTHYSGGQFHWPVVGGGNYISQYFHYGHEAIDIAGDYGSRIVAAAGGRVIFAGWKSNGGGYQVWISHGGGVYTTYNHMAGVSVGSGQGVGRGQQVGRLGSSGLATGPHLHFEVWIGPVWNGGTRVNPLRYF